MTFAELVEALRPFARSVAPARWPSISARPEDPDALWHALAELGGEGFMPALGDSLPGSERDSLYDDAPGKPIPMVSPTCLITLELLGPWEDGSRIDGLETMFAFGNGQSLHVVAENGRPALTRYAYLFRFAETGYEGHWRRTVEADADRYADLLWSSFSETVRERIASGPPADDPDGR